MVSQSIAQFNCGSDLVDARDNQTYSTVQIGSQCWMSENLNIGTLLIITDSATTMSDDNIIEKYCYDNNIGYCDTYGGLYQWNELMQYNDIPGSQGICPADWHIPTDAEYTTLVNNFPASTAGTDLQSGGSSGFDALTGGYVYYNTYYEDWLFVNQGDRGYLYTSTNSASAGEAVYRLYFTSLSTFNSSDFNKNYGLSVRCVYNGSVGVDKQGQNGSFGMTKTYPNPAYNEISIDYNVPAGVVEAEIIVFSLLGQEVDRVTIDPGKNRYILDVSQLDNGTYFLKLQTSIGFTNTVNVIIL